MRATTKDGRRGFRCPGIGVAAAVLLAALGLTWGCAGSGSGAPGATGRAPAAPTPSPVPNEVAERLAQEGPERPPPPLPMEPLRFPPFAERTLSSGARVIVVEQDEQPFVTVNLLVESGTTSDPRDRVGVASMAASLLDKGTESRTAREIAEAVDFIGADLGASASADWTSVRLGVLTGELETGLDLLADVVLNPTFPEDELENLRTRELSSLQVQLSQPEAVASRRFTASVYGDHPYGKLQTPGSLEKIDREAIRRFHRDHYRPSNALFIVAGDVDADEITARLEKRFSGWRDARVVDPSYFEPPERESTEIILVHKPGSIQAVFRAGHLLMEGPSDDWVRLRVLQRVLGGGSQGRLFQVLREEKGWTYGAYAGADRRRDRGLFRIGLSARNEVTDSVVAELLEQVERIRSEPVPADELEAAKDYLVGSFPLSIETPQEIAGQVAETRLLGLPEDHLETYRDELAAVTPEAVATAARKHIHPDRLLIVVVGDAAEIRSKLTPFGQVRMYDVEGERISLADLEVKGSTLAFDPSGLPLGSFTYEVKAQGNVVGEVMRTIDRGERGGRPVYVARMSATLGPQSIRSEVSFTRDDFRPVESTFDMSVMGQQARSELKYESGTITGFTQLPGQDRKEVEISAVPGTLMGDMQELAIWLADLETGGEFELPVVLEQQGKLQNVKVTVGEVETVEVPAGSFEAYRVEVRADQTQILYARKEAPHIIVKTELTAQPVVFELKSYPGGEGGPGGE